MQEGSSTNFQEVSTTFSVPFTSYNGANSSNYLFIWAGLGGFEGMNGFWQAGIEINYTNAQTILYTPWYLSGNTHGCTFVYHHPFPVGQNDSIVIHLNTNDGYIDDLTSQAYWSFNNPNGYVNMTTAEWIAEPAWGAPMYLTQPLNFSSEYVNNAQVHFFGAFLVISGAYADGEDLFPSVVCTPSATSFVVASVPS